MSDTNSLTEIVEEAAMNNPLPPLVVTPAVDYTPLIQSANNVLALYKQGHTVNKLDDYKYPGFLQLATELEKLKAT